MTKGSFMDLQHTHILEYLAANNYEEVDTFSFYRKIFPAGLLEAKGGSSGKPNGILVIKDDHGKAVTHFAISDELEELTNQIGKSHVVLAPIAYYGQGLTGRNAGTLHALTINVELSSLVELERLLQLITESVVLKATYFVIAGTKLQLYYIYEDGQELSGTVQKDILQQKANLIEKLNEFLQLQIPIKTSPLAQSLPMVGSMDSTSKFKVRAYAVKFKK